MVATLAIASLAWISSAVGSGGAPRSVPPASAAALDQNQLSSILTWAQQEDGTPIKQVGENTNGDVETLDSATPLAEEVDTTADAEPLDQGPPAGTQDDIELLDQGPPAAVVGDAETLDQGPPAAPAAESSAPSSTATEPATTSGAPAITTGPVVPAGFGTGSVHVSTGSSGFAVGLEDCHVGAVTGRAFVGIGCGDGGGSSFVGQAPSFEAFPFVLDQGFPFDGGSVFADRGEGQSEDNVITMVSNARGATRNDSMGAPEVRNSGASSVSLEQRARDTKPRVETKNGRAKHGRESRRGGSASETSAESQNGGNHSSAASKQDAKIHVKDSSRQDSKEKNGKKGTNAKHAKKDTGKNSQKSQTTRE